MSTEVEARILGVDVARLCRTLERVGAVQYEDALLREVLFAPPNGAHGEYVRVRDDGQRVTITHKRRIDDLSRLETEFFADDYDAAVTLFEAMGLPRLMYREKHRTSYRIGGAVISIDRYPGIPAFAEVEAPDPSAVEAACALLGLDFAAHFPGGVPEVYLHYGIELAPGGSIQFSDGERGSLMARVADASRVEQGSRPADDERPMDG